MNKLPLCVMVLLAACSSNICTMDVATMSVESAVGTVDLIGTFDESQPILILTSSGGAATSITCDQKDGSTIAAVCDLKAAGVAAGTYNVSFDMTCHAAGATKDALAVGDGVAKTLKVN